MLWLGFAQGAGAAEGNRPEELISSPTASLTITKSVISATGEESPLFSFAGSLGGFGLADGQSLTFAGLAPGSYTVTEVLAAGWQLDTVICQGAEPQVSLADATVTVTLEQGQPAACTFYNYAEQVAGPELPFSGSPPFTMPVLISGLWALLVGLALAVWSLMREADRA